MRTRRVRVAGHNHWIHVARTDCLTHYGADARRGKLAIDAVGILPQFKGICVRDGLMAYDEYRQATHALCNVHLLRELVYVEELSAEQQRWTRPLAKLLLDIKAEVERAQGRGETKLSDGQLGTFTARYDRLVKRAARLNRLAKAEKPVMHWRSATRWCGSSGATRCRRSYIACGRGAIRSYAS